MESVDNFTLLVILVTFILRLISLAFGYLSTQLAQPNYFGSKSFSVIRELTVTLYFSICGSIWFLQSVGQINCVTTGCLHGFTANFLVALTYSAFLFAQSLLVVILMPLMLKIENKYAN
jgi:hypothetical protein